jgi:protein-disulfide isomerase
MPSGKKSKQARRAAVAAPPPVVSKGSGRRRQADPRILWIAAGVVGVIVVAIVLAVVFTGGSKSSAKDFPAVGTLDNALPGATEINTDLKGIPQKGMTLGDAQAPVTMVQYIDLQCPICREFEAVVTPELLKNYVRPGKVKIESRVLKFIGPDSEKARNAMLAAAQQNKAYNFALVLYANQGTENTGWVTDNMLGQIASSVPGMQIPQFFDDKSSSSVTSQGKVFDRQGDEDQVPGTPTIYVGKSGTKGKVVNLTNADDYQSVADAIDKALQQ